MVSPATIHRTIGALDRVFHNEKDFHIAFSRQLAADLSGVVRPEFPVDNPLNDGREQTYLDIIHLEDGHATAIELKYPLDTFHSIEPLHGLNEVFNHSKIQAYDIPMYEFWKDVATVERLVANGSIDTGYVLSLTNYEGCWQKRGQHLNAADFLTYDGRQVTGTLAYSDDASAKTKENYPPLHLSSTYELTWQPYQYTTPSHPEGSTEFQYALIEVDP
ncbi:hypothetical protein [Natronobacterium gregoryi]|uniref:Uncharacterized protein n=2 Tax=Natronobacterium gregoryi TaxID=44930 RepID=L0AKR9_NATGS|nr:hypothetical protein [Natronobacterium gregoryi]AFZ73772.1 hypothetical protein Natgr_2623 [Natronobacterium gregoryi SP2]ELY65667.1 hypothetical protein C490_13670 [Natronobacterium gregoryi SP2]PLK18733.1 hypothetical protein CYV19_17280 [Natronobacterium gregoryi SP2]SFJ65785.1 hypothetical protein SAMN05443661_1539 [Natronobacterium gregoryi]